MGDANADTESRMANSGTNLQADILKVGHHSSATSSSSAFHSKVHPRIRVIEVGAGNSYGHPISAALGRLARVGSAEYRTDLNDDATLFADFPECREDPERQIVPSGYHVAEGRGDEDVDLFLLVPWGE